MGRELMAALSTNAIMQRLGEKDLSKRLVISPLLDCTSQAKAGQAAVDVRLGFEFCLIAPSRFGAISEFGSDRQTNFGELYRREFVHFGESITIHPHQFMLAQTLEYLRLPPDLMAYVVGRSTWGRLGLIVATAVGIHPGFAGSLTLELRNLGETPLTLYPGQTIAQLFFHQIGDQQAADADAVAIKTAQYVGTVDMIPRRISDPVTRQKLEKLKERFDKKHSGYGPGDDRIAPSGNTSKK